MALLLHALPAPAFSLQLPEKPRACRRGSRNNRRATVSSSLPEKAPIVHRHATFHPAVWDDSFIESLTTYDEATISSTRKRIDELKEKLHYMIIHGKNPMQMMNLVDATERLGLAYHFEKDIQSTLQQLYEDCDIDDNLHDVALRFRLLRQDGYDVSCDVFEKFKDRDGRFKQNLRNDVYGLLSLYDASHLSIYGEDILDEALNFTTEHLKSVSTHSNPAISRHVKHALDLPLHKCIPRLEIRRFISYYETTEERNNVLLELAKLDFNLLQSYQRREIKEVARWRKELDFTTSFPFARDRLVELYLVAAQIQSLPQFSKGRMTLAKYCNTFPIIDDIYDAHGTSLDELELFTNAFAR